MTALPTQKKVHAPFRKVKRREMAWSFGQCDFPAVLAPLIVLHAEMSGAAIQNESSFSELIQNESIN